MGDLYSYLIDWDSQIVNGPGGEIIFSADFNRVNGVSVPDIYDYLSAWSGGCP